MFGRKLLMVYGTGKNFVLEYSVNGVWEEFHSQAYPLVELYSKLHYDFGFESTILKNGSINQDLAATGRVDKQFVVDFYVTNTSLDIQGGFARPSLPVRGVNYILEEVVGHSDKSYIRVYPDVFLLPSMYVEVNILSFKKINLENSTHSVCRLRMNARKDSNSLGYSNDLEDVLTADLKARLYDNANYTLGGGLNFDSASIPSEFIAWEFDSTSHTAYLDLGLYVEDNTTYLVTYEEFFGSSNPMSQITLKFRSGTTVHSTTLLSTDKLRHRLEVSFTTGVHNIYLEMPVNADWAFGGFRKLRIWKVS
jgi:hypothetical protein